MGPPSPVQAGHGGIQGLWSTLIPVSEWGPLSTSPEQKNPVIDTGSNPQPCLDGFESCLTLLAGTESRMAEAMAGISEYIYQVHSSPYCS